MKHLYNSALKKGALQGVNAEPTTRFSHMGCDGIHNNIVTDIPLELLGCDVVYCEPPFPRGIKVFDERAGEQTGSHDNFAKGFARMWNFLGNKPRLSVASKPLLRYLPAPDLQVPITMNGNAETLSCWGIDVPAGLTSLELCGHLGERYQRLADPLCGYGGNVIAFWRARKGNTFVACDYDARCITVVRSRMDEDI